MDAPAHHEASTIPSRHPLLVLFGGEAVNQVGSRQARWSKEAREAVKKYLEYEVGQQAGALPPYRALSDLITKLVSISGNSRDVCRRFARRFGVSSTRKHRPWTTAEQQRMLDLIVANPPREVAKMLNRSTGSVRTKLRRLGATAQMGREWFTKRTLAAALHVSVDKVQQWIERGWLKSRLVETGKLKKEVIAPDDFAEFCKQHREDVIGARLNVERLEFVRLYVFPPSHKELLPVRESKKEREAFQDQSERSASALS